MVELPRETGAHLAKVLRARSGDAVVLFNGDGREFSGTHREVRGSRVTASIGAARQIDRESPLQLTLVQCVPRGDRMDFIVQKATELGVARIVPVLSQRSVVRLDARQAASKQAHWRAVAVSACEQCGRNRLPDVSRLRCRCSTTLGALPRATARRGAAPRHGARDRARPGHRRRAPSMWHRPPPAARAQIAIGPEGGFTPEELEAFDLSAFRRVALGPAGAAHRNRRDCGNRHVCRRGLAICRPFPTIRREPPTLDGAASGGYKTVDQAYRRDAR